MRVTGNALALSLPLLPASPGPDASSSTPPTALLLRHPCRPVVGWSLLTFLHLINKSSAYMHAWEHYELLDKALHMLK